MKDSKQSTTQTVQYPGYISDAQQNLINLGGQMNAQFMRNPNFAQAGFTPDQTQGFDLMRDVAQTAFTQPQLSVGAAPDVGGIVGAMNPWNSAVVDTTMNRLKQNAMEQMAAAGARSAAGPAGYGGSRSALGQARIARDFNDTAAQTMAGLRSQGYDRAQSLIENSANRAITAASANDALRNNQQQRQMAALQGLLSTGGAQQQFAQQNLNIPFTALDRYRSTVPNVYGSTTTGQQPVNSSPLGALLGLGLAIAGSPNTSFLGKIFA